MDGGRERERLLAAQSEVLPIEDEIELLDYIEVMVRRRWLIILGTVLCALASFWFTYSKPAMYRAEAMILPPEEQNYLNLSDQGRQTGRQSSYVDILQGFSISRKVVQKVYPYELEGKEYNTNLLEYFGAQSVHQGVQALQGKAEFTSEKMGGGIKVVVGMRSPQLSAAVANEYIAQLISYNQEKRKKLFDEQLIFIEERVSEIQEELSQAEKNLVDFQRRNRNLVGKDMTYLTSEQMIEHSRLQREIDIRSSLLSTILNQYEVARVEAKKEIPDVEVLYFADPEFTVQKDRKKVVIIGFAVGLLVSVFLAFFLEYVERNRQSGRMEPIMNELRKDRDRFRRVLGKGE